MASLTYPEYPDEGLWAIRFDDGSWLTTPNSTNPQLFQYKYRAVGKHARFIKGSRVVPVALIEKETI